MKDYLGDGAYVEFNGYEVILSAPRGPDQIHTVVLGRYEYEAFKRFMQRTPWEKPRDVNESEETSNE